MVSMEEEEVVDCGSVHSSEFSYESIEPTIYANFGCSLAELWAVIEPSPVRMYFIIYTLYACTDRKGDRQSDS